MAVAQLPPLPPPYNPLDDGKRSKRPPSAPELRTRDDRSTTYAREMVEESGLLAALAASVASDRLVVVKFYAPYCRSCKAVGQKLDKLSKEMYQKMGLSKRDVIIYEVNVADERNFDFFQKHKVTHLPTFRFYRPTQGMLENFVTSPAKFGNVRVMLRKHLGDYDAPHGGARP